MFLFFSVNFCLALIYMNFSFSNFRTLFFNLSFLSNIYLIFSALFNMPCESVQSIVAERLHFFKQLKSSCFRLILAVILRSNSRRCEL